MKPSDSSLFYISSTASNTHFSPNDNIILLTFDDNYVDQSINLILSIAAHNEAAISFICICPELSADNLAALLALEQGIQINCCEIREQFTTQKWPLCSMFRLLAPWILDNNIKRILYLDSDTICTGDLQPLFHVDVPCIAMGNEIQQNVYFMPSIRRFIPTEIYCNSGVLIMNLDYFRDHHSADEIIQKFKDTYTHFDYPDQDYLNIEFNRKITYINGFQYNFIPNLLMQQRLIYAAAVKNAKILHFATTKPWEFYTKPKLALLYYKNSRYPSMIRRMRKVLFICPFVRPFRNLQLVVRIIISKFKNNA